MRKKITELRFYLQFACVALSNLLALGQSVDAGPISSASDVDISDYTLNEKAFKQAGKAYGYIIGQKHAIEILSEQFPEYAHTLQSLGLQFDFKFNWPGFRSKRVVRELTRDEFDQWSKEYIDPIREFADKPYNREQAERFNADLQGRLHGEMDPEVLSTLLWLKYANRPVAEMIDGWSARFDTRGHEKSLGLDVSFEVPLSWKQKAGVRPHVVQQWVSQNGSGLMNVILTINELPLDGKVTMDDMRDYVFSDDIRDFVLDEGELLHRDVVVIDTIPTAVVDQKFTRTSADVTLTTYQRAYIFFAFDTLTFLTCSVADADANAVTAQERFPLVVDLCSRIARTTSVANTYY